MSSFTCFDKSPLLLAVNKKSSETLSALVELSNNPLSYSIWIVVLTALCIKVSSTDFCCIVT